jgi:hypothetical protein
VVTLVLHLPKNNILGKRNVEVNIVDGLIVIILGVAMLSVAMEQHFIIWNVLVKFQFLETF